MRNFNIKWNSCNDLIICNVNILSSDKKFSLIVKSLIRILIAIDMMALESKYKYFSPAEMAFTFLCTLENRW